MDGTDIGFSDHFLVWMVLGRASKTCKKRKRVIISWCLDRFGDDEVKLITKIDYNLKCMDYQSVLKVN